jgi:hypothetical protein
MEKDKTYKMRFWFKETEIVFTGTIISDDGEYVVFRDKFGKILEYNKDNFISSEEVLG